jgi:hypothetical protein
MPDSILQRIPVVGGVAYIERVQRLPATFQATLAVEPENRYFRHAIAVIGNGEKVGYVAPEIAPRYFDAVKGHVGPLECPARRAGSSDHETSGVELLLDFSSLPVRPAE